MSTGKKIWIFLIAAPFFGIFLAGLKVYYDIQVWTYSGEEVQFEVKPGESFSAINGRLMRKKLISNPKVFHRYAQINGHMTKFKAGKYKIENGMNMLDVIHLLMTGAGETVSVTIPEGKNLYEIGDMLEQARICSKQEFVKAAKDPELAKKFVIPASSLEGYLFPDTYMFTPGSDGATVAKTMVNHFKTKLGDINLAKGNLSPHEVVILASIVEKETGASHERPMISQVYLNRLNKKMRLQSDPTTIYGVWETFDGNLRKKHLQEKTPYNTYRINGLPKGPIANPGLASITAVLEPADHDFIFFVSKNDGTHVFSKTYQEHKEAVDYWQKNRSNRAGKSWRDLNKKNQ